MSGASTVRTVHSMSGESAITVEYVGCLRLRGLLSWIGLIKRLRENGKREKKYGERHGPRRQRGEHAVDDRLLDLIPWFIAVVAGVFVAGILALVVTFGAGLYEYEYRCTDNVVESRLHIWNLTTIGAFDPIDGDPVGACNSMKTE